eukprot:Colp12_sorted_trinity150504_noHs@9252
MHLHIAHRSFAFLCCLSFLFVAHGRTKEVISEDDTNGALKLVQQTQLVVGSLVASPDHYYELLEQFYLIGHPLSGLPPTVYTLSSEHDVGYDFITSDDSAIYPLVPLVSTRDIVVANTKASLMTSREVDIWMHPKTYTGHIAPYSLNTKAITSETEVASISETYELVEDSQGLVIASRSLQFEEDLLGEFYSFQEKFAKGGYGEVWRAVRKFDVPPKQTYILKRLFVEKGEHVRTSGLREIHFNVLLQDTPHIARFVEYFEVEHAQHSTELWLVFCDEGESLHKWMYSRVDAGGFTRLERSAFWRRLREYPLLMKSLLKQLLEALASVHERGVLHRDIKPDNVIVREEHGQLRLKLADLGSAVDLQAYDNLYTGTGPSRAEATLSYAPPEVIFTIQAFDPMHPEAYDLWSVGMVFLEMFLGTPDLYQIDNRARARLDRELDGKSEEVKKAAHIFHAMKMLCIYEPAEQRRRREGAKAQKEAASASEYASHEPTALIEDTCNSDRFAKILKRLDPLRIGLDHLGVTLLRQLLAWKPEDRPSAAEALRHAYFDDVL